MATEIEKAIRNGKALLARGAVLMNNIKTRQDALGHLAQAVDCLIEAAERSKRQESVNFWGCIERARTSLRAARSMIDRR